MYSIQLERQLAINISCNSLLLHTKQYFVKDFSNVMTSHSILMEMFEGTEDC